MARFLTPVILNSAGFALFGLISGGRGAVLLWAACGALVGLFNALLRRRESKRAERYRSEFDPPGPGLAPESLALPVGQAPAVRRYRGYRGSTIGLPIMLGVSIAMGIWLSLTQEPVWMGVLFGALFTAGFGPLVWTALGTYTEVGPHGIRLRTPRTTRMIPWAELAGVGWAREDFADFVLLSTQDGQQVKAVGICVHPAGEDRKRALRMLNDIEHHWALNAGVLHLS